MNKYIIKRLLSSFVIIAILVGGVFISYDFVHNNFRFYYFLGYFIACLVIIPTGLRVYWFIKQKRETLKPSKLQEVYIDHARELVSDKEKLILNYASEIKEIGGKIYEQNFDQIPRVIFYFPKNHKYNSFQRTSLKLHSVDVLSIDTMMLIDYPLAFSIKRITKKSESNPNKIILPSTSKLFSFHTTDPSFLASILAREGVNELLVSLKNNLMQLSMNRKFVEARFRNMENIEPYLNLLDAIHEEILLKEFDVSDVEEIHCYQCDSIFETNEEICEQCGAHRPNCKVCLLDLQPSEKEEVVKSPCCRTYFHRNHLIIWLEEHATCPFCKNEAFLWIRTLKQDKKEK
ncbi:MAG: hypothetical protein ACTSUP_00980 [Candidatus Heimdallarchaeaceae archaeon]